MQLSRQEYWSGLPFPSPGDLPNPGIRPRSPALQADSLLSEPPGSQIDVYTPDKWASQVALVIKNPPANSGDTGDASWIPGSERLPGEGNGNPLQYSCLENPMDWGACGLQSIGLQGVGHD